MRYKILFVLLIACNSVLAQISNKSLTGAWIKVKTTYNDGGELPDSHPLKYAYTKYTFGNSDNLNIALVYFEKGNAFRFTISENLLYLKSENGSVLNSSKIVKITKDSLILIQDQGSGYEDSDALKYIFIKEATYQNTQPLTTDDIFLVKNGDTVYKSSSKIYADYKGESFQKYIYDQLQKVITMQDRKGHFLATFIVSKNGLADSLKILEGIDPEFDKQYVKAFKKAKKDWKPAILKGKNVDVQMSQELRYSISAEAIPQMLDDQKATKAFNNGDYQMALYYYDLALKISPNDKLDLLNRGLCKMELGNMKGACEDWNKVRQQGSDKADSLLTKYCN